MADAVEAADLDALVALLHAELPDGVAGRPGRGGVGAGRGPRRWPAPGWPARCAACPARCRWPTGASSLRSTPRAWSSAQEGDGVHPAAVARELAAALPLRRLEVFTEGAARLGAPGPAADVAGRLPRRLSRPAEAAGEVHHLRRQVPGDLLAVEDEDEAVHRRCRARARSPRCGRTRRAGRAPRRRPAGAPRRRRPRRSRRRASRPAARRRHCRGGAGARSWCSPVGRGRARCATRWRAYPAPRRPILSGPDLVGPGREQVGVAVGLQALPGAASPQGEQQVAGPGADGDVALGVLAPDLARARRDLDQPLAGAVGAVQVQAARPAG